MINIKVSKIGCEKCVQRISNELEENGIKANVDLVTKSVTISNESDLNKTKEILDNIGYSADE